MKVQSHRDLLVWKEAMLLVEECYELTQDFPRNEEFGLKSQIRRAAVSIPANIAEGHARHQTKEFIHFLCIARGSLAELDTQIELALRMKLFASKGAESPQRRGNTVGKMLTALIRSLNAKL